jgi:hypothetical protein
MSLPDTSSLLPTEANDEIPTPRRDSWPASATPTPPDWDMSPAAPGRSRLASNVVFRTARRSALDEDLQTGIAGGDYLVAFEVDAIDEIGRQGWSVLIQGPAHHVSETERESAELAGVEPWAAGERELFTRIVPNRVTGRRIQSAG